MTTASVLGGSALGMCKRGILLKSYLSDASISTHDYGCMLCVQIYQPVRLFLELSKRVAAYPTKSEGLDGLG